MIKMSANDLGYPSLSVELAGFVNLLGSPLFPDNPDLESDPIRWSIDHRSAKEDGQGIGQCKGWNDCTWTMREGGSVFAENAETGEIEKQWDGPTQVLGIGTKVQSGMGERERRWPTGKGGNWPDFDNGGRSADPVRSSGDWSLPLIISAHFSLSTMHFLRTAYRLQLLLLLLAHLAPLAATCCCCCCDCCCCCCDCCCCGCCCNNNNNNAAAANNAATAAATNLALGAALAGGIPPINADVGQDLLNSQKPPSLGPGLLPDGSTGRGQQPQQTQQNDGGIWGRRRRRRSAGVVAKLDGLLDKINFGVKYLVISLNAWLLVV